MALGIGATAAVYSVLYGVLIDPYPYHDAAHIASIVTQTKADGKGNADFTLAEVDLLRRTHAITDIIAERRVSKLLTAGDFPESIHVEEGTGNLLQFLDAPPILGRVFTLTDAPPQVAPQPVAVLSYLFWKSHFAGSPSAVGATIELNHARYTILGVMGPRFTWTDADVYLPLPAGIDPKTSFQTLFRLRPGLSNAALTGELSALTHQIAKAYPEAERHGPFQVTVESLNDNLLGEFKGTLLTLFVAVLFLLLIGCGNVSILLLARGQARRYELAMRSALGASPARIVRQLLTEAVFLSVAGGLLGIAIAYAVIHLIVALVPEYSIPHEVVIGLNLPVLVFSTLVSVATGVLAGLSPALQLAKTRATHNLQAAAAARTASATGSRTQGLLITGQIALTVLLLAASGAAIRQFLEAYRAHLGFDPHNVLLFFVPVPEHAHQTWQERANYEDAMIQTIDSVPGVEAASPSITGMPPGGSWLQPIDVLGAASTGLDQAAVSLVGADYFSVMKVPLLEGRALTRAEILRGAHVAVVSSLFAKRRFPNASALGRQFTPRELSQIPAGSLDPSGPAPYQIVGIAADVRNDGLHRPIQPQVYLPTSVLKHGGAVLFIRTNTDPAALIRPIGKALGTLDANQSVNQTYIFQDYLGDFVWARERFISSLFGLFALVALSLAAIGLISVIAFQVVQRTREIGIRSALGASRANILRIVLQPTMRITATGLLLGILLTLGLSGFAFKWTQSSMRNASVLSAVCAVLLAVAAVASLLTARRAMLIQPVEALRNE